jgi:nitronate monooxygenase
LGADAINMGTRFLVTTESSVHEKMKQRIVEASERDTALIFRTMRNTARVFKNSVADRVIEMEAQGGTIEDIGPLVSGERGRAAMAEGDLEGGIWSAGMVSGLIRDIPSCQQLIERIVSEAEELIVERIRPAVVS